MFFTPKVATQPSELPKSTLSLKIKVTQKLFMYKKDIPDEKPGLMFQFKELQEKWETLAKPPEKNDFLEFLSGVDAIIDRLIGQNDMHNMGLIDKFSNFGEECLVIGVPYFGPTMTSDFRDYMNAKNYDVGLQH